MLGSGLRGIEKELPLGPAMEGNAYTSDHRQVPTSLRAARDLFAESEVAREILGDEVGAHYTNYADVELTAYDATVTDWERVRGFERL
jgi:glutamine synthetase